MDVSKILEVKVANGSVVKTQGFCNSVPVHSMSGVLHSIPCFSIGGL